MPAQDLTAVYAPHPDISRNAYVSSIEKYRELYKKSIDDPNGFWGDIASQFHWETQADPTNFFSYNFNIQSGPIYTRWMTGASTNISYNLLDRNVKNGLADQVAYYWWVANVIANKKKLFHSNANQITF